MDKDLSILQAQAMQLLCTELTQRCQGPCKQHPNFETLKQPKSLTRGRWTFSQEPDAEFDRKRPLAHIRFRTNKALARNDLILLRSCAREADQAIVKSFADLMDRSDGRWIDNVKATQAHSILNMDKFTCKEGAFVSEYNLRVQELWHGCQFQSWVPHHLRKILIAARAYVGSESFERNTLDNDEYIQDLLDHGTHVE